MPHGLPEHSQHHKPLQARPSFSDAATAIVQQLYLRSASLHQAFLFIQVHHHVSAPSWIQKPVSMSLPHEPQLSTLLVRWLGWSLLPLTTCKVCDFSLATHVGIPVQTGLRIFFPLKRYNFNEHNYKRI